MEKGFTIKKVYMWIMALMPLLSVYGIQSIGLDFGTLLLLIGILFYVIENKKLSVRIDCKIWWVYVGYMVISLVFPFLIGCYETNSETTLIFRGLKNIVIICVLLISTSGNLMDYQYFKSCYLKVSKIATYYLLLQSILYYGVHYILPGYIEHFLLVDSYSERLSVTNFELYRPTSLFYEPSHYFEFISISLIFYLFDKVGTKRRNLLNAALITIGVVLSTSGMGIVSVAMIWGLWFLTQLKLSKKMNINVYSLLAIVLFGITVTFFLNTQFASDVLSRLIGSNINTYSATDARTEIYKIIFARNTFENIYGAGYGNVLNDLYYPSWAFNFWCLGVIGTLFIVCIYWRHFKNSHRLETKVIIFINAFLSLFTTLFMGKNLLFYFCFVLLAEKERYNEKENCYYS